MTVRIRVGKHWAIVDDEDAERVAQFQWHAHHSGNTVYARTADRRIGSHLRSMHALLLGAPGGDHINGNGLDNRRANLRSATPSENRWNAYAPRVEGKGSRFKGVCRVGGLERPWQARIRKAGVARYLGSFATEEEAARAYDRAALELFGEFAKTNEAMGLFEAAAAERPAVGVADTTRRLTPGQAPSEQAARLRKSRRLLRKAERPPKVNKGKPDRWGDIGPIEGCLAKKRGAR